VTLLPLLLLCQAAPRTVGLRSLLDELADRSALARLPCPGFVLRRAAPTADEGTILDVDGPGAVVRIVPSRPAGTVTVRLDGRDAPLLREDPAKVLGWPIPFAGHCKITTDRPGADACSVEYRVYPPGTAVASVAPGELEHAIAPVEGADRRGEETFTYSLSSENPDAGLIASAPPLARGPRAITQIVFRAESDDLEEALRRAILRISFDGEETVACPLRDFFAVGCVLDPSARRILGSAPGADPPTGRPASQIDLVCRWVQPYERSVELRIENRGRKDLHVAGQLFTGPWTWDDRSLRFHARWRRSGSTPIRVEGRGLFVGQLFSIAGAGRGQEVLAADGLESAPPALPASEAHLRILDAIPFEKNFRASIACSSSREESVEVAATSFYYARPGAKDDTPPIRD